MSRSIGIITATLTLSISCAVAAVADPPAAPEKGKEMVTCPITRQKVEKSKAIAVKTKSGKTVYVCCPGCVEAAKQLK
jgi:hypothetical protein